MFFRFSFSSLSRFLAQIKTIIYQSDRWLALDPSDVMVIHCKGGKGRTGMIVACLLLEQGITDSPEEALSLFARMRTSRDDLDNSSESAKKDSVKIQRVSCSVSLSLSRHSSFSNPICLLLPFSSRKPNLDAASGSSYQN